MAQFGRAQPYRPHLVKPIVAPGGPVIPGATIVVQTEPRHSRYERRGAPHPHVTSPVVTGSGATPVAVPRIHALEWDQSIWRPQVGRTVPKPHVAPLVAPWLLLQPVIAAATKALQNPTLRSFERRGGHRLLPGPVVAPGGPVVPGITEVLVTMPRRDHRDRVLPQRRYWPSLLTPVQPAIVTVGLYVTGQASSRRTFERRGVPRRYTAVSLLAAPSGGAPLPVNLRTGLFPRGQWKVPQIRLPQSPIVLGTAVVPGITVLLQGKQRALVGRTIFRPHLSVGIVAPGKPAIPGLTVLYVAVNKKTLQSRRSPQPHVAPANLTQPAPVLPLPPAIVKGQALRRVHIGRTTPRPHTVPGTTVQPPLPPTVSLSQCRQRDKIGRTTPRPHFTGPLVTPPPVFVPPVGPGLFAYQARQRMLIGRRLPEIAIASPIAAAPAAPQVITFNVTLGDYRWKVYVSHPRWTTESSGYRWSAALPQPRWNTQVSRYA